MSDFVVRTELNSQVAAPVHAPRRLDMSRSASLLNHPVNTTSHSSSTLNHPVNTMSRSSSLLNHPVNTMSRSASMLNHPVNAMSAKLPPAGPSFAKHIDPNNSRPVTAGSAHSLYLRNMIRELSNNATSAKDITAVSDNSNESRRLNIAKYLTANGDQVEAHEGPFVRHGRATQAVTDPDTSTSGASKRSRLQPDVVRPSLAGSIVTGGTSNSRPATREQPLSAHNAQAYLPPSACVFVANLTKTRTDAQLEASVKAVFEKYGKVYVKIRRDGRGMPYGFCQYESNQNAYAAVVGCRERIIDGRPCRTEPAKVNRAVYMSRIAGGDVSEEEARAALSPFGEIEAVWKTSITEREIYQLPEGAWVKFAFFQACRDAQRVFRSSPVYRLSQPASATEASRLVRARSTQVSTAPAPVRQQATVQAPVAMPTRWAVWLGGLGPTTTRDGLRRLCAQYGTVVDVEVCVREAANGQGYYTYAFVDFSREDEAHRAVCYLNNKHLKGYLIQADLRTRRPNNNIVRTTVAPTVAPTTPPNRNKVARPAAPVTPVRPVPVPVTPVRPIPQLGSPFYTGKRVGAARQQPVTATGPVYSPHNVTTLGSPLSSHGGILLPPINPAEFQAAYQAQLRYIYHTMGYNAVPGATAPAMVTEYSE